LKLKNAPGIEKYSLFLIVPLLACSVFFAGCSGDSGSTSSPTLPVSNAQTSVVTAVGASAVCLTIYPPSLRKLADGNYRLVDEIDNCGGKDAGPLKVTTRIDTATTKQSANLLGPATLAAHGKAQYTTFTGQTGGTNKEIRFPAPRSAPSAVVTLLATINGVLAGEWDGQVTIPAKSV
jgi:hypothetical protein